MKKKKKHNKTICSISKTRKIVECKHLELNLFVCIVWVAAARYYNGINWFASGFCYLQQVHAVQAKNKTEQRAKHVCKTYLYGIRFVFFDAGSNLFLLFKLIESMFWFYIVSGNLFYFVLDNWKLTCKFTHIAYTKR